MSNIAKLGDIAIGVCYAHEHPIRVTGIICSGSPNVNCNNMNAARIGDVVIFNCGHSGTIVTGSGTVSANNLPLARIGDIVKGPMVATIVSGSGNSFSN